MVDARVLQQSSRLIAQPVSRSEAALEIDLSQMKNSQLLEALSHVDNTEMEGRLFRTISVSEFPSVQFLQQQKTHKKFFYQSHQPGWTPLSGPLKCLVPPVTKFWPKVHLKKRVIQTKLNSRQKCVNQVNLI